VAATAHLEALLRARKLDVTLTSAHPLSESARPLASSGLAWLDRQLGGGWPRGETSEIVGPVSSGRTAVLCATLAAATSRGEIVALVDALDRFDPVSGVEAGIALSHVLWARGHDAVRVASDDRRTALMRALDRAVKAFGLVLQAGGFGVAVLDVGDVPARALARLPFTTWMRLHRAVEGADTLALIVASEPVSRSARGLSLRLALDAATTPVWAGASDRARVLSGVSLDPQVTASRLPVTSDQ
jgi:RecA/RadA recombinase